MTELAFKKDKIIKKSLYYDNDFSFKFMVFFYKLVQVAFGLDFGFMRSNFIALKIQKILTLIQCTVYTSITIWTLYQINETHYYLWFGLSTTKYVLYVLILMTMKRETSFSNSIQNLRAIDTGLNNKSHYLEIKLLILILIICLIFRTSMLMGYMIQMYEMCLGDFFFIAVHGSLYFVVHATADIVRLSYAFIFCAIYSRLRDLKELLKTKQSGFLSMQYFYKSIVDIAEQHKEAFDPVLISCLMFNVPQSMYILFDLVNKIREIGLFKVDVVVYIVILEMLLLSILPAVCAGFLSSEAKQIRVVLHNILLKQQDNTQSRDLERFIRYVKARGCRFRVCKLLPLDASLLSMVLSFCVTYLIVIIQFTNN